MAKGAYTSMTIARAREHHRAGWTIEEIRDLVAEELGRRPTWHTVRCWIDPGYAHRLRGRIRRAQRASRERKLGRKPIRNVTPEWEAGRVKELHDGGLAYDAIVVVARLWWGAKLTEHQVRGRLNGRRAYSKSRSTA
jgi:hypothetical protein